MVSSKGELLEWLNYEKSKYGLGYGLIELIKLFAGNEVAVIWALQKRLRITEYHHNTGHRIRYRISAIFLNYKRNKYGLNIGINVCDKGLKIMHLGSILTNGATKIGKDCSLHINTAFVAPGINDKAPIVGNGVVVGVGAVVVGGVTVADNVAIGANSVVCKSIVEENIAVAGAPAKKVSENGRLRW